MSYPWHLVDWQNVIAAGTFIVLLAVFLVVREIARGKRRFK